MTLDELEAVVRAQLTRVVTNALQAGVPSTAMMNRATEIILEAASRWGLAEYGITADRRQALAEATASAVHLNRDRQGNLASACGRAGRGERTWWTGTTDPAKVTCGACKRTGTYRAAVAQAVAS